MAKATVRGVCKKLRRARRRTARMLRSKVPAGARVAGAATGDAGMMPELKPVPLGRCRGPWRERQHRTGATIGKSGKRRVVFAWECNSCECNEQGHNNIGPGGVSATPLFLRFAMFGRSSAVMLILAAAMPRALSGRRAWRPGPGQNSSSPRTQVRARPSSRALATPSRSTFSSSSRPSPEARGQT